MKGTECGRDGWPHDVDGCPGAQALTRTPGELDQRALASPQAFTETFARYTVESSCQQQYCRCTPPATTTDVRFIRPQTRRASAIRCWWRYALFRLAARALAGSLEQLLSRSVSQRLPLDILSPARERNKTLRDPPLTPAVSPAPPASSSARRREAAPAARCPT
ncbi:hypothetical protein K458DRAFT_194817 [Lentithecium fluviatile CBS 122367]|uniref:Uncharacterized protein n=1 Tax=Lentithecium fluviatile CBS 122367 TaxID=1168545 RepID=A0A6G1ID18_9PLEO|nr:hypothetical protein K458DRAFT_194817 [Lentithecium fluviatile CBS 122367]